MDVAFDLSENGRKLAHATSSVCSKPTGELGSCYECKMSPVGSGTKGMDGALWGGKENIKPRDLWKKKKVGKKSCYSMYF